MQNNNIDEYKKLLFPPSVCVCVCRRKQKTFVSINANHIDNLATTNTKREQK